MITFLLGALAAILLYFLQKRPKNFPPGPLNLPFIGALPAMIGKPGDTPFDQMERLQKNHGNIVGFFLGTRPAVLISGYEGVKEVCAREEFTYRPKMTVPHHKVFDFEKCGIFFVDGEKWKSQRRFTLRNLRDFGFGKKSMDHFLHQEVNLLVSVYRRMIIENPGQSETGLDYLSILPAVAVNTLWYIIAGKMIDLDNSDFIHLTKAVLKIFRLGKRFSPTLLNKTLQKIPILNSGFQQQAECGIEINKFIKDAVDRHLETYDESEMRDFIDVYIREMKKDTTETFSEKQLVSVCMDLFMAGTETSSSTTSFILRYLIKYPEIQEKVREEIYQVVGKERYPSTADMANLHYCMAVLTESLRHSGVAPSTPPKAPLKDTNFQGFIIPKGATVLVNLRSVNMDKKYWGDPEVYRPERFIGPNGKFQKDDRLMLFGSGTRLCLGEPFAKNNNFVFFTSIIQNFKVESPPYGPKPSDVTLDGFTTAPEPFKMTLTALN